MDKTTSFLWIRWHPFWSVFRWFVFSIAWCICVCNYACGAHYFAGKECFEV